MSEHLKFTKDVIDEVFRALWDTHPSPGRVADAIRDQRDLVAYQREEIRQLRNQIGRAKEIASRLGSREEYESSVTGHAELRLVPTKLIEELMGELQL